MEDKLVEPGKAEKIPDQPAWLQTDGCRGISFYKYLA